MLQSEEVGEKLMGKKILGIRAAFLEEEFHPKLTTSRVPY